MRDLSLTRRRLATACDLLRNRSRPCPAHEGSGRAGWPPMMPYLDVNYRARLSGNVMTLKVKMAFQERVLGSASYADDHPVDLSIGSKLLTLRFH